MSVDHPADDLQRIPPRRWLLWWSLSALWWLAQGVTSATITRGMSGVSWERALIANLTSAALWVPVTVLALWMAERATIDRHQWKRTLPLTLGAAFGVVVIRAAVVVATNDWVGWYRELPSLPVVLFTSLSNNFFLFVLLVGVGHAIAYARRVSERDRQLARAELQHLKAQLHPHFLFNALNAISATVRSDPELATRMLSQLSVVLRHAIRRVGAQEVPLEEELQLLTAYVEIEQLRFEDKLRVQWHIDPDARQAMVPHLLLQPLVENAIRHGIAPSATPGTVEIGIHRRGATLHLSVSDTGVGWTNGGTAGEGIGLSNTRSRLRQLYGSAQSLQVRAVQPRGIEVDVSIPFREARSA